jgi:hypothetical protein
MDTPPSPQPQPQPQPQPRQQTTAASINERIKNMKRKRLEFRRKQKVPLLHTTTRNQQPEQMNKRRKRKLIERVIPSNPSSSCDTQDNDIEFIYQAHRHQSQTTGTQNVGSSFEILNYMKREDRYF